MTTMLNRKLRRDLSRQRAPFIAVAVTVLLGVALFGAAYDAFLNLQGSYDRVFDDLAVADVWVTGGDTVQIATQIASLEGVETVATRHQIDVAFRVDEHKLQGRLIGLPEASARVNDVAMLSGARPAAAAGSTPQVLAEDHLAAEFGLTAGDDFEVLVADEWQPVTVSGSASSGEYLWLAASRQELVSMASDFGVAFAPAATIESLTGAAPNQVLVRGLAGQDREQLLASVAEVARPLGASDIYSWDEQPSNAALAEDINGFSQMALLFPMLFLTAAGMASYTLLSRRIHAERSIIGMLRAQGASRRAVLRHYLGYGLVAGLGGAVPGTLLGLWLARLMTRFYVGFLSLPITAVAFHPETLVIGIAFGVVAGGLAALAPARLAAATPPAEAMRGIVPAAGGRRGLLERLIPASSHLSASSRLVLRSIGRNRRRTAMTISGVVLSLLLVLVSWSMLDTIQGNLDAQFSDRDRSDATVVLARPGDVDTIAEVAGVGGVETVEAFLQLPVTIATDQGSYATVLEGFPSDTTLRSFDIVEGGQAGLNEDGLLAGVALKDLLGINVGDTVSVSVEGLAGAFPVRVAGFVQETLGTFAFVGLEHVQALLGEELGFSQVPTTSALITYADGVDGDAMRRQIESLDGVASVRPSGALRELLDDVTGLLVGFVTLMLIVGGVLAGTMIFTTVSVSIAERSNEVATLRASGVPLRRIARLITTENLIVTLLGVAPGVVLGILGGRAMMQTYTTDQFSFEFLIAPTTIVGSCAAIIFVAALSQIPGLRALRRLDLAATVRERSA